MRIALVTADAGGNVPPLLDIAGELVARGASVQVLGHARQRDAALATGAEFEALDSLGFWNSGVRRSLPSSLAQFTRLAAGRSIGAEVRRRADRRGADAVLVDCMLGSAVAASVRAGLPTAVLFHSVLGYWTGAFARGPLGAAARVRGVDLLRTWRSADRRLVVAEREFEPLPDGSAGAADAPAAMDADWLGSSVDGAPAHPDPDRPPQVLVSLSTTWLRGQAGAYQRIATALGTLPVRGLVTTGGLPLDRPLVLPPNVTWVERADHGIEMARSSMLVGHGGYATASRALAHDLPGVHLPMNPYADQPMVAAAVERHGAGLALPKDASSERIAAAVAAVLADASYRRRAAALGARIRTHRSAAAAADILFELAERRRALSS